MHVLQNPVNVINEVPSSEGIEDGRTLDTAILRKIQIIANLPDNFSLTKNVMVVLVVLQAVDIRSYFHNRKPPSCIILSASNFHRSRPISPAQSVRRS